MLGNGLIVEKDFEKGVQDWEIDPENDENEEQHEKSEDILDTYFLDTNPH